MNQSMILKCLEEEKGLLLKRIRNHSDSLRTNGHSDGGQGDFGDCGQAQLQAAIDHISIEEAKRRLAKVEMILKRAADGEYGKCAACGKQIAEERLRVLPTANKCLECQQVSEKRSLFRR